MTNCLLLSDTVQCASEGGSIDVDKADRQNLLRILHRHRVEDAGRDAEALVGLPGADEVLKRDARAKATPEDTHDHRASVCLVRRWFIPSRTRDRSPPVACSLR